MKHRSCPKCGQPVPWDRLWFRAWAWATWSCQRCGASLTIRRRRRWLLGLLAGATFLLTMQTVGRSSLLMASAVVIALGMAIGLLDGVALARESAQPDTPSERPSSGGSPARK